MRSVFIATSYFIAQPTYKYAVSVSEYVTLTVGWLVNGELEWIWKEAVVPESHSIPAFPCREWKNESPSSG
jgi:hypothetical protein